MTKVYLAARYSRHPEMREVRDWLEQRGFKVTARWIDCHTDVVGDFTASFTQEFLNTNPEKCAPLGQHDIDDLVQADVVISFTGGGAKGGRHVEFGYAVALGKRLIVVGPRENVFHTLPQVEHFPDWPPARAVLEPVDALAQWDRTAALIPTPAEWNAVVRERDEARARVAELTRERDQVRAHRDNLHHRLALALSELADLRPAAQEAGPIAEWLRGTVHLCLSCGLDENAPSPQCAEHPTKAGAAQEAPECDGGYRCSAARHVEGCLSGDTEAGAAQAAGEPPAPRVWRKGDPEPPAGTSAKDRYGDVWTRYTERHLWKGRPDGIGHSWEDIPAECCTDRAARRAQHSVGAAAPRRSVRAQASELRRVGDAEITQQGALADEIKRLRDYIAEQGRRMHADDPIAAATPLGEYCACAGCELIRGMDLPAEFPEPQRTETPA